MCEHLWSQWCRLAFMEGHASDSKCSWSAGLSSYATCQSKPVTSGWFQDHSVASNSWRLGPVTQYGSRRCPTHPRKFWPFSAVCLTVFLFKLWPRTFTLELYEKKPTRSEIMILDCSCPLIVDDRNEWSDYLPTIPSGRRHPVKYLHTVHWCLSASAMLPPPPPPSKLNQPSKI